MSQHLPHETIYHCISEQEYKTFHQQAYIIFRRPHNFQSAAIIDSISHIEFDAGWINLFTHPCNICLLFCINNFDTSVPAPFLPYTFSCRSYMCGVLGKPCTLPKKKVVLLLIQNAAPFLKIKQFTLLKYSNRNWIYRIFNKVPVRI